MPKKEIATQPEQEIDITDPDYNERVQKYFDQFKKLEKEKKYDEMLELLVSPHQVDPDNPMKEKPMDEDEYRDLAVAFDFWAKSLYKKNAYGKPNGFIKEGKEEAFEGFSKALGRDRAKHGYKVGCDIEETKQKIRNGEIKGAEKFVNDEKALNTIASSYVYDHSPNTFNMNLGVNASLSFSMFANWDILPIFYQKMKEGTNEYKQTLKDEKERSLVDAGFDATSSLKCRKYGLKLKGERFVMSDLKNQIQAADIDEFDQLEAKYRKGLKLTEQNRTAEEAIQAELKKEFPKLSKGMAYNTQYGENLDVIYSNLAQIANVEKRKEHESFGATFLRDRLQEIHDSSVKYLKESEPYYDDLNGKSKERKHIDAAAEVRGYAEKIIRGAKEDLEKLENMTRKNHKNSVEYTRMRDALKDVADLDLNETSLSQLQQKLTTLTTESAAYEQTHDRWNKAVRGFGKDRLGMSKHFQAMVTDSTRLFKTLPAVYKDRTLGTLHEDLIQEQAERKALAKELIGKTGKMVESVLDLSSVDKYMNMKPSKDAVQECKDTIDVLNDERVRRFHACAAEAQKDMENASGEKLRDLAAAAIYYTGIEKAAKMGKNFTLKGTIGNQTENTNKIKNTPAFAELSKLPDEELRALAAKGDGRQLTARYMNLRMEAAEMESQKKQTRNMTKAAGLQMDTRGKQASM